jgi:hypothetical protein
MRFLMILVIPPEAFEVEAYEPVKQRVLAADYIGGQLFGPVGIVWRQIGIESACLEARADVGIDQRIACCVELRPRPPTDVMKGQLAIQWRGRAGQGNAASVERFFFNGVSEAAGQTQPIG